MAMIPVEGQVFENATIIMDNKYFSRCSFSGCTLIYTGGDFGWIDCKFDVCILQLEGAALRSAKYLHHFKKLTSEFSNAMGFSKPESEW